MVLLDQLLTLKQFNLLKMLEELYDLYVSPLNILILLKEPYKRSFAKKIAGSPLPSFVLLWAKFPIYTLFITYNI